MQGRLLVSFILVFIMLLSVNTTRVNASLDFPYSPVCLQSSPLDWDDTARIIGGFYDRDLWNYDGQDRDPLEMTLDEWNDVMAYVASQHATAIDLDLGLYYYEAFMDPSAYIQAISKAVKAAHDHGLRLFTYQAGFEMQTERADEKTDTVYKSHPDWLQRGPNGEYAVFNSSYAFWIAPGDEDTWITPLNPEWRSHYMDLVKAIIQAGVDGFYVDVPYFVNWSYDWGSYDPYMTQEFQVRTGFTPPKNNDINMNNYVFRLWLKFRQDIINEFFDDIKRIMTSMNPEAKLIVEIYGGYAQYALWNGPEIEALKAHVDVITHEFGLWDSGMVTRSYTPKQWLFHASIISLLRGIDNPHPTWMLQYGYSPPDMFILGSTTLGFGANFWETKLPSMLDSVDDDARTQFFSFTQSIEQFIYGDWKPEHPVLVYYSSATKTFVDALDPPIVETSAWDEATDEDYLNYFGGEHIQNLIGTLMLLLKNHIAYRVVTNETLSRYNDEHTVLILPSVQALSSYETTLLTTFQTNGNAILTTGSYPQYNEIGNETSFSLSYDQSIQSSIGKSFLVSLLTDQSTKTQEELLLDTIHNLHYQEPFHVDSPEDTIVLSYVSDTHPDPVYRIINYQGVSSQQPNPIQKTITIQTSTATYSLSVTFFSIYDTASSQLFFLPSDQNWISTTNHETIQVQDSNPAMLFYDLLSTSMTPFVLGLMIIFFRKKKRFIQ